MEIGFSSYTGLDFLLFYTLLLAAAVFAGFWIPANLRTDGSVARVDKAEELAMLAGGPVRLADSVLSQLYAAGLLRIEKKKLVTTGAIPEGTYGDAERDLLGQHHPMKWGEAREKILQHGSAIDRRLTDARLLMSHSERVKLRWLSVLPYVALMLIGGYRWLMGNHLGEPVGFLTMLLFLTLVLAIIRYAKFNPRTDTGNAELAQARSRHVRLESAPRQDEIALGVALYGTVILVGTPYAPVHDLRQQSADAGSGAGDGGCGDGGGCGGGCGGCGG